MFGRTNTGSGGGGGLNFKVICNPQPSTAKENTIWVDTDKINNYYFSAEQPENMVDYDVWFPIGTSSIVAFNALKKNGIQVYPISAKQHVSGACVDKTAKSWQGGKWVDWWNGVLFDNGDQYEVITGGWWQNPNIYYANYPNTTAPTIANTIHVKPASSGVSSVASTKNKINLSGFKRFYVEVTGIYEGGIFLHTADTGDFRLTPVAQLMNITSAGKYYIDIDSSWPPVYISFGAAGQTNRYVTVSKIWLER